MSYEADRYKRDGISMVPKGCPDKCGNVSIYYPFGIGPDKSCYLNEWFLINCTKSSSPYGVQKPYLRAFSDGKNNGVGEILGISLEDQTITIQESISPLIRGSGENNNSFSIIGRGNTDLSANPFLYYTGYNKFMLFGCGNALLTTTSPGRTTQRIQGGCTSVCRKTTEFERPCYGINCCQSSLGISVVKMPYQVNLTDLPENTSNYAFIVAENWFPKSLPGSRQEEVVVPVVWGWSILYDYLQLPPSSSYICLNGSYNTWYCECQYPNKGNPYLANGCQGNDKLTVKQLSAIIGVCASFGFLLFLLACFILYKTIKKRKMKKLRHKFFKRNGGLLLQQQLLAKEGTIEKTKIFTVNELDKATDHFNANRILGRGGQGTVYKGMLIDGEIVAVKKSQAVDEDQVESFINEVVILSQINHRNVVKLLGCCLETEVPILVYEFIPNGTLFSLIHNNFGDELIPLSWDIRLRIASEVASALSYLHSATSIPIYHRDIKSSNILLDEKFRAKVSDFGTSRSISIDQTHLTTVVKGTFGYLDPEYFQSSQFTDKSDVYSFGVVLAELLTGQKPISFEVNDDEDRSLVTRFLLSIEENRFLEILDREVSKQGKSEDVMAIALLAQRCLNLNGKKRPTMKEVAAELDAIRASHPQLHSPRP
ncbi:PREDICTED: wall-associated receptor kinase-like 1 [Ipomoea nil]|uniref:wall-associated receptor kinase-like 1 n=1 Tax=Ipomoea nil TaxID=35883 RepID=UPI000901B2C6|nr:PREDICTED: wall-associated receptor kinase-like 1 [Ipomoea nil]